MKLHEPVKNFVNKYYPEGDVTQYFGENPALYRNICNSDKVCLVGGHNGADYVRPWGTDIMAVEGGIVADVKNTPEGYGMHLRIISEETSREWTYGHNSHHYVKVGDRVEAGDVICRIGNTGFVVSGATPYWKNNPFAGTHLHLGMREIKLTNRGWRYNVGTPRFQVLNYNNGFMGSVDFNHLMPTKRNKKEEANLTWRSSINKLFTLLGLDKPAFRIDQTSKLGDKGEHIKEKERMLVYEGYLKREPTGVYDKEFADAALEWQLHHKVDKTTTLRDLKGHFFGPKSLATVRKLY